LQVELNINYKIFLDPMFPKNKKYRGCYSHDYISPNQVISH
jgi:hypothetical protein